MPGQEMKSVLFHLTLDEKKTRKKKKARGNVTVSAIGLFVSLRRQNYSTILFQ